MADKIERIIADTFLQMAEGLETGNFGKKPKIALTGMGSEHGEENAMEAAKMAAKDGIEVYYIGTLEAEGVTVEDGSLIENAVQISDYDFLYRLKAFREGSCYVQDESSMLCAKLASVQKEQFVMDLCSAPGGKSLYVADQLKGSGRVLSRDLTEYKTDLIEDNIDRVGFTNMESEVFDARVLDEEHIEAADVVVADVPCSGLGIMGKKNDIKYHISEEGMKDLVKLQREILANAVQYVKHGGTLIYSTCTINPAENEENFRWILDHFEFEAVDITKELPKDLKIETAQEGFIQLLPGIHPCDGFFIGKLRRK